jgi:hypothetical protein
MACFKQLAAALSGLSLAASGGVGCVGAQDARAYPLYSGAERAPDSVATLEGDVEAVDGTSVSAHGHRFALEPGCHTVTNVKTWGGSDPSAAVTAHLPEIPFAIEMKPGLTYVLRISTVGPVAEGGRLQITAVEQDANGTVLRQFEEGTRC